MGIPPLNPEQAARGPTNAKRNAVTLMLRQHGFERVEDVGDAQHQHFAHPVCRDESGKNLRVAVVGHAGDMKPGTVADAGKACLKVQQERRRAFSQAALEGMKDTELAAPVRSDQVTAERLDDKRFVLRDARYPELGIIIDIKASPAQWQASLENMATMREDHAQRLGKLERRGYSIHADGLHPTRLLSRDDDGLPEKALPLFDGNPATERQFIDHLRDAKHHARDAENAVFAVMENADRLRLVLDTRDEGGTRHFRLLDPTLPLLASKKTLSAPPRATDIEGKPAILFESSEDAHPNLMSRTTREQIAAAIGKAIALHAEALPKMIADAGHVVAKSDGGIRIDSRETVTQATVPTDASDLERCAAMHRFLRDDEMLKTEFDKVFASLEADGLARQTTRKKTLRTELRYKPLDAGIVFESAFGTRISPASIDEHRESIKNIPLILATNNLLGGYEVTKEPGRLLFEYPADLGGQKLEIPECVPGRSIKAKCDEITALCHEKADEMIDLAKRDLPQHYGYTENGRKLVPPPHVNVRFKTLYVPATDQWRERSQVLQALVQMRTALQDHAARVDEFNLWLHQNRPLRYEHPVIDGKQYIAIQIVDSTPVHIFPAPSLQIPEKMLDAVLPEMKRYRPGMAPAGRNWTGLIRAERQTDAPRSL